jgi:hypothetical protein
VAQSGLLAQQDSRTPALTVLLSVLVSLLGTVVLVAGLGWGLAGAAITTTITQYVGAAALLYALSIRGKVRAPTVNDDDEAAVAAATGTAIEGGGRRKRRWADVARCPPRSCACAWRRRSPTCSPSCSPPWPR